MILLTLKFLDLYLVRPTPLSHEILKHHSQAATLERSAGRRLVQVATPLLWSTAHFHFRVVVLEQSAGHRHLQMAGNSQVSPLVGALNPDHSYLKLFRRPPFLPFVLAPGLTVGRLSGLYHCNFAHFLVLTVLA
jgi:hypothetical protein